MDSNNRTDFLDALHVVAGKDMYYTIISRYIRGNYTTAAGVSFRDYLERFYPEEVMKAHTYIRLMGGNR